MIFDLSAEQELAATKFQDWWDDPSRLLFLLFGYAGTGKTTLAQYLAGLVGEGKTVIYAAYTGKAAHELHKKGCADARTIHSLIYSPREACQARLKELNEAMHDLEATAMSAENDELAGIHHEMDILSQQIAEEEQNVKKPVWSLKLDSDLMEADLLIIDEMSFVDQRMGEDLLGFGTKMLVMGDPAQLPPVHGKSYFNDMNPDFTLEQIHRQAQGNPIIDLSMQIRAGNEIQPGQYGDTTVVRKEDIDIEERRRVALDVDQILCGRNVTRHAYNDAMRGLKGYEGQYPLEGERLVCLQNDYPRQLLNGQLFNCYADSEVEDDFVKLFLECEEGSKRMVEAHRGYFEGNEPYGYYKRSYGCFEFGYCLTVHKAQGSQYGKVMLIDEWPAKRGRKAWLYTAYTRASESLTVVQC